MYFSLKCKKTRVRILATQVIASCEHPWKSQMHARAPVVRLSLTRDFADKVVDRLPAICCRFHDLNQLRPTAHPVNVRAVEPAQRWRPARNAYKLTTEFHSNHLSPRSCCYSRH